MSDADEPSKMTTDYVAWVLSDGTVDHFTAQLIRLIAKSDVENRARLRMGFPLAVAAYEAWIKAPGGKFDPEKVFGRG